MSTISQFIENYKQNILHYESVGRLTEDLLSEALSAAGIRAIVTSRIKHPNRLLSKVMERNKHRALPYQTIQEIYDDIADLIGLRVSLYFPGDRKNVDQVICDLFQVSEIRQFPIHTASYTFHRRFPGYCATHYRVFVQNSVRIEIQVASVLMHAWSEVEHDLVYKPTQGELSDEELSILDELNGLVLTGEIALERLQKAGMNRNQSLI